MKRISLIFIAFAITVAGAISASAQSNNDKIVEQILKLEAEYTEAFKKPNTESFEAFHAPDFMVTSRIPPRTQTKAEIIALRKDPNVRRVTIESLTETAIKVRVYGDDTAVATGAWKQVGKNADSKEISMSGRFTHVWVKQNGKWLLAGAHYSPDIDLEKLKAGNTPNESKKEK